MSKRLRSRLIVKTFFFALILLSATGLWLGAQGDEARPAGGAWNVYSSEDKMTAARQARFELIGNNEQREARGPNARGPYDNNPPAPGGPNDNNPPPPRGPYDRGPRGQRYDNPPSQPRVEIECANGEFRAARFVPGMRIAPPNRPGFWGQPQMQVLVRVNDSHSNHGWNWTPDSLSMDKNTTREMIGSQLFRVEYLADRGPVIAEFSPAGLELGRVAKACGLKPKKP